jgi:hypothetical protein
MGRLEVQGIVAAQNGQPYVQFRQEADDGTVEAQWQVTVEEAREIAQNTVEAAANAVYDAAIMGWANQQWPDDPLMGARMLAMIRDYRTDAWGREARPGDWRQPGEGTYGLGARSTEEQ